MFRPAKEMHVVRHDNVATNRPTMTFARTLPFFDQHAGSGFMGENVSPISCAYCDKINWWFDPDTSKEPQPTAAATTKTAVGDRELQGRLCSQLGDATPHGFPTFSFAHRVCLRQALRFIRRPGCF